MGENKISFYDKKALVVLTILWNLVKNSNIERKQTLLHRIQQVMVYYKIGINRNDFRWIRHFVTQMSMRVLELSFAINDESVMLLTFWVAEHYREIIKNNQKLAVWETLENFTVEKISHVDPNSKSLIIAEKLTDILIQDNLYLLK